MQFEPELRHRSDDDAFHVYSAHCVYHRIAGGVIIPESCEIQGEIEAALCSFDATRLRNVQVAATTAPARDENAEPAANRVDMDRRFFDLRGTREARSGLKTLKTPTSAVRYAWGVFGPSGFRAASGCDR